MKYGGSASCQECHQKEFDLWTNSHHALAERPFLPDQDRAAFDPARTVRHGSQTSEVRSGPSNRFELVTANAQGQTTVFPLERVIGVNPLIQFLAPERGGRLQVTELAVDTTNGAWFDIFGDEDRKPGEWGHWTGRGMTWNTMCAVCHNTRLLKNYRATNDTYATTFEEMGVGCEACHGPLAAHNEWQKAHPGQPADQDPTLRPISREQHFGLCGGCHSRRAEFTGDFLPGEDYSDHHAPVIPDETDIYYPDGQVRDEDYEYVSFLGSRLWNGGIRCFDCHDPHSGKTRRQGNDLCMYCHQWPIPPAPKINPIPHQGDHKPGTAGSLCTDCHMPQTPYMQRHWRHDHGFTIPDPQITKEYGIPNACNRCHKDKSVDWSIEYVNKWYGPRMERPSRQRARTVADARLGKTNALPGLLQMAVSETNHLWRAVAVNLLKHWAGEPAVAVCLQSRLADTNTLVRALAARALEALVSPTFPGTEKLLTPLLNDPSRHVRIEAAWSLRRALDTNSAAGRDLLRYLEHNADQPSGLLQMGIFFFDRDNLDTAMSLFRKAVEWDAHSAPLHHALAMGLNVQGKMNETVRALETACRLAPQDAEYRFKLALALNETGQLERAAKALEETVKIEPNFAQAWYNLGLACSTLKQPGRAIEALQRAEGLDPHSARIPYARATLHAQLGSVDEARQALRRALDLQPGMPEAAALLQMLEGKR